MAKRTYGGYQPSQWPRWGTFDRFPTIHILTQAEGFANTTFYMQCTKTCSCRRKCLKIRRKRLKKQIFNCQFVPQANPSILLPAAKRVQYYAQESLCRTGCCKQRRLAMTCLKRTRRRRDKIRTSSSNLCWRRRENT